VHSSVAQQCCDDAGAAIQAELLDAAAPLVRPGGGVLVYSTCSIEAEENQQQVLGKTRWADGARLRLRTMPLADPASIQAQSPLNFVWCKAHSTQCRAMVICCEYICTGHASDAVRQTCTFAGGIVPGEAPRLRAGYIAARAGAGRGRD
jgi:16S rRNA methyltransferase RsmB/F